MKIKKGYVKRKIDDVYLVITTTEADRSDIMIELNETSSFIWDCVAKGYDVEKIATNLSKEYDITIEKATESAEKIIANMKENGIIEED